MRIKTFRVSEVNDYINKLLSMDIILSNLQVEGEISNFKLHSSGHMYFSLKDQKSRIRCVMFRSNGQLLKFFPEDGMKERWSISAICSGNGAIWDRSFI